MLNEKNDVVGIVAIKCDDRERELHLHLMMNDGSIVQVWWGYDRLLECHTIVRAPSDALRVN